MFFALKRKFPCSDWPQYFEITASLKILIFLIFMLVYNLKLMKLEAGQATRIFKSQQWLSPEFSLSQQVFKVEL